MSVANLEEFDRTLRSFAIEVVPEVAGQVVRAVGMQALGGFVNKTPVDTGRARGGWQAAMGEATEEQVERLDPSGQAAIAQGASIVDKAATELGDFTIFNNVEYIEILEEGRVEGSGFGSEDTPFGEVTGSRRQGARGSIQAPQGMVAITLEEIALSLEQVEDAA